MQVKKFIPVIRRLFLHPKRALRKAIHGEVLDEFLARDRAAWEHAGYLHPEREGSMRGMMIFHSHCVEKGLTMPGFAPGHSTGKVLDLCQVIAKYRTAGYDMEAFEYRTALGVLSEYRRVHRDLLFTLPQEVEHALQCALEGVDVLPERQLEMSAQDLWKDSNAPFPVFSASRHSVRHFIGSAPHEDIMKAMQLATNAPCACNKQYVRVHLYEGKDKVQPLLAMQNGNRGFGENAEQLIIVTSDMSYMHWRGERHEIYLCAGLFAMNLGYALHYHHVAHCMLNWQVEPGTDREMRALAGIPDNEEITLLIVCGIPADSFKATSSPRRPGREITTIH